MDRREGRVVGSPPVSDPIDADLAEARPGTGFLVYRDGSGRTQLFPLETSSGVITVGRGSATDLWLDWDSEVSRVHAKFERIGDDWTVVDDGLSSNGTFVNGERIAGQRRLRNDDVVRLGKTEMTYRAPLSADSDTTAIAS